MDSNQFDSIVKAFGTGASRRGVLRGVTAAALGAVVAVTGSGLFSEDASAGHSHKKQATRKSRSARGSRQLGQACSNTQGCDTSQHLHCENVGATGARRCECDNGFVACGGVCVALSGSGGPLGCSFNASACACECPADAPVCTPSGGGTGACVSRTCSSGTFNESTCRCEVACGDNEVFCGGCCRNIDTACSGFHNKNFNAKCCSCENPGQPSGNCKGTPLTSDSCPA
jgi:hypothetical protein